jgi:YVTN family beta-propeller protein
MFEEEWLVKTTLRDAFHITVPALLLMALSACGGGGGGGGTSPPSVNQPVSSGFSPTPVPTIAALYPSCAPAGEQFIDGVDNQLTVIGPTAFVTGSVVRWNGSDRPTSGNGSINAITAQISASDIATAGTAVVTVFNPAAGGGSSNSLSFTITSGAVDPQSIVVDPTGKFAYVLNGGCGGGVGAYVSMYTLDPNSGSLASIGPPVSTYDYGDYAGSVTVAPSGKFAYVTNSGDPWDPDYGSIATYAVNATTGALNSTGTINGNCPGLCFPSSMVMDPSGKFAYVVTGGGGIPFSLAMYTIDAATGALTSIGTIAAGGVPNSIAVDPAGEFVYVAAANVTPGMAGSVSTYAINATTGALTSIGTIAAGTYPVFVAVDPAGKFAYVVNNEVGSAGNVSMYAINATTGALASIGTIAAGTNPVSAAVDPSSKFAYVTNFGSNDVSMYTIDGTTGSLTVIGTITVGLSPSSIAVHPSGKFAYVTNSGSNEVSIYSIGVPGTLTFIATIGT